MEKEKERRKKREKGGKKKDYSNQKDTKVIK